MRNRLPICFLATLILFITQVRAQIKVSDNQRFLQRTDGKPFFWLGDTDWELFHRLTREEADELLETRKQQGFNVIHTVALAEMNGLHVPNRYGDLPLINDDPSQLSVTPGNNPDDSNEYDYWDHVDYIINKAAEKNVYIGLLPTWGDKVAHLWGDGPIVFNEKNAATYARTLAERYGKKWNVIWILGGDRPVQYTYTSNGTEKQYDDRAVWNAMARAIEEESGKSAFITYHPSGGTHSNIKVMHQEPWLDMNAFQSGHGAREYDAWNWIAADLTLLPTKPVLDMEPCYEDHPVNPWDGKWTRKERGYFTAYDVRARIYREVLAGACGVTYGHHSVWQFLNKALYETIHTGDTLISWQAALHSEGAEQMKYLKKLVLSRPYFSRIADQSLILSEKGSNYIDLIYAARDENKTYAMIYLPQNKPVSIDVSKINGSVKNSWWFDPGSGKTYNGQTIKHKTTHTFTPPANGNDWVLIIDDASEKYVSPEY
jgi:hypothetical protein